MPIRYDDYIKPLGLEIEYSKDQIRELALCQDDLYYFCKYVKIINPDKGRVTFVPRDYQREILDSVIDNRYSIIMASRQCGKSTTIGVYVTWYACFNGDKRIGIVSNKESSAKDILSRIKIIYEELPSWLKPGSAKYNEKSIVFENGTIIEVSATSKDAFRGRSLNLLFCLEGESFVTVRDKNTKEEKQISLRELYEELDGE